MRIIKMIVILLTSRFAAQPQVIQKYGIRGAALRWNQTDAQFANCEAMSQCFVDLHQYTSGAKSFSMFPSRFHQFQGRHPTSSNLTPGFTTLSLLLLSFKIGRPVRHWPLGTLTRCRLTLVTSGQTPRASTSRKGWFKIWRVRAMSSGPLAHEPFSRLRIDD